MTPFHECNVKYCIPLIVLVLLPISTCCGLFMVSFLRLVDMTWNPVLSQRLVKVLFHIWSRNFCLLYYLNGSQHLCRMSLYVCAVCMQYGTVPICVTDSRVEHHRLPSSTLHTTSHDISFFLTCLLFFSAPSYMSCSVNLPELKRCKSCQISFFCVFILLGSFRFPSRSFSLHLK